MHHIKNKYLCTSMPSTDSKPIIYNAGEFYLQPRSISVRMVQTPTELDTQHIYSLDASGDHPLSITPLVFEQKINHKYPKSLCIPILNAAHKRGYIPRSTAFGMLNANETESTEGSNISWTKTEKSQDNKRNSPTELPTIPPETCFIPRAQ